jgi:hypothetical protein
MCILVHQAAKEHGQEGRHKRVCSVLLCTSVPQVDKHMAEKATTKDCSLYPCVHLFFIWLSTWRIGRHGRICAVVICTCVHQAAKEAADKTGTEEDTIKDLKAAEAQASHLSFSSVNTYEYM